ncbi:hypothetical protein BDV28DRAFT_147158 [Aspergillus coremiiformis]|uniref:Cyanovirin-N domain-containing protein n=1 Tax=Aspergillus coremiiformis TaxID=138285 RepID=A0A5N6ZAH9_9EURO|nr:hypothetical protein BDV28DRAFT_147158 [Aspergillus coremiiformis]
MHQVWITLVVLYLPILVTAGPGRLRGLDLSKSPLRKACFMFVIRPGPTLYPWQEDELPPYSSDSPPPPPYSEPPPPPYAKKAPTDHASIPPPPQQQVIHAGCLDERKNRVYSQLDLDRCVGWRRSYEGLVWESRGNGIRHGLCSACRYDIRDSSGTMWCTCRRVPKTGQRLPGKQEKVRDIKVVMEQDLRVGRDGAIGCFGNKGKITGRA